jgi:hypothetical protein
MKYSPRILWCLVFVTWANLAKAQTTTEQICKHGDCNNGFGYTILPNEDFYIGFTKNGKIQGQGLYYFAQTATIDESLIISFNKVNNGGGLVKAPSLRMNLNTNEIWLGDQTPGQNDDFSGIYFDIDQNMFKSYPSGNLPVESNQNCLDGDCKNSLSTFKWTDSKGWLHFYHGGFMAGKFEGQGIEFIPKEGKALIGKFVNDSCEDGILYDLLAETAKRYKGGSEVDNVVFKFPFYSSPIPAGLEIKSFEEDRKAKEVALAERRERRKKLWGNIATGAAVVGLAYLNEQEAEAKREKERNRQAVQNRPSATGSNSARQTSSNAAPKAKCRWQIFWSWTDTDYILTMSTVYSIPPPDPYEGPSFVSGKNGLYTSNDKDRVIAKREDIKKQFELDGYRFRAKEVNNKCGDN